MLRRIYLIGASLLLSIPLTAQTTWSAEGPGISVWAGASISTFNPDYGCRNNSPLACWHNQLLGITPFVDTNAFLFGRIGAEGEARFLHWRGPGVLTEASYMGGPRVYLFRHKRIRFSGKFLLGEARINLKAPTTGTGNYLAYAPGAAVDYRVARRMFARVDYEYQIWPSFKGSQTGSGHGGLTPNGLSFGISYALRR